MFSWSRYFLTVGHCFTPSHQYPLLLCLPGVSNCMCPLLYGVFLCLSGLAQICTFVLANAPRLDVSACRVQSGMCSPMHRFCLEGPDFFVLNNAPCLLCLPGGPNSYVLTIAPRLLCVCLDWPKVCICAHQCTTSVSVCLEGPIWYVLTNASLLFGGAQFCLPVLNSAPCL